MQQVKPVTFFLDEIDPSTVVIDLRSKLALTIPTISYYLHMMNLNINLFNIKFIFVDVEFVKKDHGTQLLYAHDYFTCYNQVNISYYYVNYLTGIEEIIRADDDTLELFDNPLGYDDFRTNIWSKMKENYDSSILKRTEHSELPVVSERLLSEE